jgi:predicted dehydrogenase/threonine dehydrogenase-like Zn-dependent dehydrogenase
VRQVIQYQKTGDLYVEEVPAPQLKPGRLLVRNAYSLISSGTERTSVETARASLLGKARSRPDLLRQVLDNAKREGFLATYRKVQNRLDNYKQLGYSSAGVVIESSIDEFTAGDRVACAGLGYACHAEVICVPRNLAVKVPETVGLDEAAFATVGAIALQGVRQADVRLGERVVVIGLGLVGLLTVQLLTAAGCTVFGIDISDRNFELAQNLGCSGCAIDDQDALARVLCFTADKGADSVLITAATNCSRPMESAVKFVRKKGTVVVVGAVGMDVPRSQSYDKELSFRMSCSYGPGRYDRSYEEQGCDYPFAYVRWTEKRNMEAVLELIDRRRLDVKSLITYSFQIEHALDAYDLITQKVSNGYVGILLSYPQETAHPTTRLELRPTNSISRQPATAVLGCIGAGNHIQSYLLPWITQAKVRFKAVVTSTPVSAKAVGRKFAFELCGTDESCVLGDPDVNLVLVGTRHDSHAHYVVEALRAAKNVFVEKPLALTPAELAQIVCTYDDLVASGKAPFLMVGYNRRFSAPMISLKRFFAARAEPLIMNYRINAGSLPATSWYLEPNQGGRLVGEVCHFIDTLQFLTDSLPEKVFAFAPVAPAGSYHRENVAISIKFRDESVGSIIYLANGSPAVEKEYLEVFGGGKTAKMLDFKKLTCAIGRKQTRISFSGGKGHAEEIQALLTSMSTGQTPFTMESLLATSRTTFAVLESLRTGSPIDVL